MRLDGARKPSALSSLSRSAKTTSSSSTSDSDSGLKAFRYEDASPGKPPTPVTVVPPPPSPRVRSSNARDSIRIPAELERARPKTSPAPTTRSTGFFNTFTKKSTPDEVRRDSGAAVTLGSTKAGATGGVRDSYITISTAAGSVTHVGSVNLPQITVQDSEGGVATGVESADGPEGKTSLDGAPGNTYGSASATSSKEAEPLMRLTTAIPSGEFTDLKGPGALFFSKRGSLLMAGGRRPERRGRSPASPRDSTLSTTSNTRSVGGRLLSMDEEQLSLKVRMMYEYGDGDMTGLQDGGERMLGLDDNTVHEEAILEEDGDMILVSHPKTARSASVGAQPSYYMDRRTSGMTSRRESMIKREQWEMAGGIEDWEDIDNRDVDRYGFIVPRKPSSSQSSSERPRTPDQPQLKRMSTALYLASEAPRGKRPLRRAASTIGSTRSLTPNILNNHNNISPSRRSMRSQPPAGRAFSIGLGLPEHPWRYATNRLPGNRGRRWMDEAGDMLTLPPGLAGIAEDREGGKVAEMMRRREWERAEKWRRMAKVVSTKEGRGGGMVFEFDTRDPKVISRTWKGIPDCWRATAWHAFLSASAKRRGGFLEDDEIVARFYDLQEESSADDMQIDIDVPRTINSHIMFRRRYRGGQRLLFRVLHALSLYFPDVGYVQGMASLAATLLCYYDEDTTFIMLVRLWELRGLKRLYQPGFEGLMQGLEEFEQLWLKGGDVYRKLTDLGIGPTAYGTRWYLTLFNYSIPFPAQLRVWDVFMLLGDPHDAAPSLASNNTSATIERHPKEAGNPEAMQRTSFNGNLDVLHATGAALIDGMREILLDSDFENAMKVLTSWIPVRDEELLMKVARAEWRGRGRR